MPAIEGTPTQLEPQQSAPLSCMRALGKTGVASAVIAVIMTAGCFGVGSWVGVIMSTSGGGCSTEDYVWLPASSSWNEKWRKWMVPPGGKEIGDNVGSCNGASWHTDMRNVCAPACPVPCARRVLNQCTPAESELLCSQTNLPAACYPECATSSCNTEGGTCDCPDVRYGLSLSYEEYAARFNTCMDNVHRHLACAPHVDCDGSYVAHHITTPHSFMANDAGDRCIFLKRESFLEACEARTAFADRRDSKSFFIIVTLAIPAVAWLIITIRMLCFWTGRVVSEVQRLDGTSGKANVKAGAGSMVATNQVRLDQQRLAPPLESYPSGGRSLFTPIPSRLSFSHPSVHIHR